MEQNQECRNKLIHIRSIHSWQRSQNYSVGKRESLHYIVLENWIFTCKRMKLDSISHQYTQRKLEMNQIHKFKNPNYKTSRRKQRKKLHWSGQWFFGCDIKSASSKSKNKQMRLQIKKFLYSKINNQQNKQSV